VGDSRAYRLRDGVLEQLTRDHSTVAELVSRGLITEAEAADHPRRNEILRSLGAERDVAVDIAEVELRMDDQLVLCSDGLSGVVPHDQIAAVLLRTPPHEAVRLLVDGANAAGGPDNVTVMIAALPGARRSVPPGAAPRGRDLRPLAVATALVAAALCVLVFYALWWGAG
jgi:protein phosphatase